MNLDFELILSIKDTAIMVIIPTIFAIFLGLPLGAILYFTREDGIYPNKIIYILANTYINIVRGFPFLIFVVFLIPFTRFIIGTAFGVYAAAFPICFVGVALYARFAEQSFHDINKGIIDAAISMQANKFQIFWHFLIVESRSSLVLGLTSSIISFISYSSVMGVVGGGGIGDYAMRYGYLEYDYVLMYKVVIIIVAIIFLIQFIGNKISKKLDKKGRDF